MPPPYCYDYPRPAVTVDLAAFALHGSDLRILLVRRGKGPFEGCWALPGGFLGIDESPEVGARREVREETGFEVDVPIHPLGFYAEPGRDPRGRTISLAYAAAVRSPDLAAIGGDDASEAAWRPARESSSLAFDHASILHGALAWLALGVQSGGLGIALLPEVFGEGDVRAMLRGALGSTRGVSTWLNKQKRSGSIEPEPGPSGRYRAVSR